MYRMVGNLCGVQISFCAIFSGFDLGASFCAELLSLDLVGRPCLNETTHGISWSASGYLPKVRARSNPRYTSIGEQLVYLFKAAATLVRTHAKLKHSNLKMQNWNTEYTDGNDVIYSLSKEPTSYELVKSPSHSGCCGL